MIQTTRLLLLIVVVATAGCAKRVWSPCLRPDAILDGLRGGPPSGDYAGTYVEGAYFFGYHPACWRPWPEGWVGCPQQWTEVDPHGAETLGEPTPTEPRDFPPPPLPPRLSPPSDEPLPELPDASPSPSDVPSSPSDVPSSPSDVNPPSSDVPDVPGDVNPRRRNVPLRHPLPPQPEPDQSEESSSDASGTDPSDGPFFSPASFSQTEARWPAGSI